MRTRGWLYGLIVFLAQTCNPYYNYNQDQSNASIETPEVIIEENFMLEGFGEEELAPEIVEEVQSPPPPPPPPPVVRKAPRKPLEEVYKVVEEMPRFPGCEQKAIGVSELKTCSEQKMLEYVYKNIKFPLEARKNGVGGMVIIQFVVDTDGSIMNSRIVREPGAGTGAEALRVINSMPRWIPGKQRGQPVKVQYNLPIRFELEKGLDIPLPEPVPQILKPDQEVIFKVVEEMPRFPGCEEQGYNRSELKKCSDKKRLRFIYDNLKYPKVAKENGIEGMVIVQFVVDEKGDILNPKILREPGGGTGNAALEVVKLMPQWIPGKQRGKSVKVQFTMPVRFKL